MGQLGKRTKMLGMYISGMLMEDMCPYVYEAKMNLHHARQRFAATCRDWLGDPNAIIPLRLPASLRDVDGAQIAQARREFYRLINPDDAARMEAESERYMASLRTPYDQARKETTAKLEKYLEDWERDHPNWRRRPAKRGNSKT